MIHTQRLTYMEIEMCLHVIRTIVRDVVNASSSGCDGGDNKDKCVSVGVISPYRAQVRMLKERLENFSNPLVAIEVR